MTPRGTTTTRTPSPLLLCLACSALTLGGCADEDDGAPPGIRPLGDPVLGPWDPPQVHVDEPFVQEVAQLAGELDDVRALALDHGEICHVATAAGLLRWDGSLWVDTGLPADRASRDLAFDSAGILAAVGPAGAVIDGQPVDLPGAGAAGFVGPRQAGGFWLAGDDAAGSWDGAYQSIHESINLPVRAVADQSDGTWFAATAQGVFTATGSITTADGLPSDDIRAVVVAADDTVWIGTDAGLASRDPGSGSWTAFVGEHGLHYGDVQALSLDADGTLLASTTMGGSRYHADGSRRYYFGRLWLADPDVRGMARATDGTVWLATAGGVSWVEQRQMTLAAKAALFDEITQERHLRLGFTSTENALEIPGDVSSFYNHDDDNDGQWTAMYLASQCYRYAVTGEEQARDNARVAAYALLELEEIDGMDGFFSRSIVPADECEAHQQAGGEWHLTDDGEWCWKGDTSADEFVGHMLGLSLFYDLVADAQEQQDVADTLGRLLGGIVDNGLKMLDVDGLVTSHGNFDPDWMENAINAIFGDAGLNSAMILGGLHVAARVTGDLRFRETFDYLARTRGYVDYVSRIEEINLSFHTNHDSEEMSFLAVFTLMRLEDDPELFAQYRHGLQYLWEVQRPERNPEFNMIFAALAQPEDYDLESSIETLQKMPLSLLLWGLDHSHRWDRDEDPELDRFERPQNSFVFPYDERQAMRWAENPYAYELRGNGQQESSGTFWLLPYWMGRYFGIIQ